MPDTSNIINFRQINDHITTSGQPTEDQLALLRDMGVTHIINLGPHTNDGALPDETASVTALGMKYIYIPVDFDAPTDQDFEAFRKALAALPTQRMHVHCIYNARVSAFFYRLSQSQPDVHAGDAFDQMDGIWRPGGVWATFIGNTTDQDKPNRYFGDDY